MADGRASTVIVFDASNSMWGQVEVRSKIEIAREVIGDMLDDWDPQFDLGLVAYGHRRTGDCGDIELVILVSGGIESCNANLCDLAEELERGGVDFTAHVIGFDVGRIEDQGQLSCLADTTCGQFLTTDTAGGLLAALQTVAAPPPPMLRLEAVGQAGGAAIDDPSLRWTIVALDREESILGDEATSRPELSVESG